MRERWIQAGIAVALLLFGTGALAGALGGCAATSPAHVGTVPPDFTIDALVTLPEGAPRDGSQPRSRRPARYLLQPNADLRAAFGAGVGADAVPPLARRLSPGEVEEIWALAEQAGLLEPEPGGRIAWGMAWDPPPTGAAVVLSVSARGRRIHVGRRLGTGMGAGLGAAPTERLIDRLAELSWEPSHASVDAGSDG